MESTATAPANATNTIVEALTKAIIEHRLHPGTKLAEQNLAFDRKMPSNDISMALS